MTQWHPMVIVRISDSETRINHIGMSINPDYFQVRITTQHSWDCCWPNGVISSNIQQKIVLIILCNSLDLFGEGFHQWWEDVAVKNRVGLIKLYELLWVYICETDVAVIVDFFDPEFWFQSFKESNFSEFIRSVLNTAFGLSLRDSSS